MFFSMLCILSISHSWKHESQLKVEVNKGIDRKRVVTNTLFLASFLPLQWRVLHTRAYMKDNNICDNSLPFISFITFCILDGCNDFLHDPIWPIHSSACWRMIADTIRDDDATKRKWTKCVILLVDLYGFDCLHDSVVAIKSKRWLRNWDLRSAVFMVTHCYNTWAWATVNAITCCLTNESITIGFSFPSWAKKFEGYLNLMAHNIL